MRIFILMLIIAALLFVGCQEPPPNTIPVTGLVTLDGRPLTSANVHFFPLGDTTGGGGLGQTDDQGRFTVHLRNNQSTEKEHPGLLAGEYKVIISKLVNPDGTPFIASEDVAPIDSNARDLVPETYSNYELSKLTVNVQPPDTKLTFELLSSAANRP